MKFLIAALAFPLLAASTEDVEYRRRVDAVRRTPGFVALWDFVLRRDGRFAAHQPQGSPWDFRLDAVNYVRDYWGRGRAATYDDFPLLGRGPFGQAIRIRAESDPDFRPCLLVPRERLHDSPVDVKGPGKSVSMLVWIVRESGNHAIAGIWHEGTDLESAQSAARLERGRRQYALFAGLAGKNGAAAAHVSENGGASFGDRYARNLAVTPEIILSIPADAPLERIDSAWTAVGFVFDNRRDTVTAYIDGRASEHWISNPQEHPFYRWAAKAWEEGAWNPPERRALSRRIEAASGADRVEVQNFRFTRVRATFRNGRVAKRELVALSANPFWFPHDLWTPPSPAGGGPFTIGRVIHSSRSNGTTGWIGGVAVFSRALSTAQMGRLARTARTPLSISRSFPNTR